MNAAAFNESEQKILALAREIAMKKRPAYTQGNEDMLWNFKSSGEEAGTTARQALFNFAKKHWDAFASWARDPNIPQGEPMPGRFADIINYVILAHALWTEEQTQAIGETTLGDCGHPVLSALKIKDWPNQYACDSCKVMVTVQ